MEIFTAEGFAALLQVMMIDLVLAGDNAIVIGLAAAGLPKDQRTKAILVGIIAATVLRIILRAAYRAASRDHRSAPRRRHPAAVGLLEDVARIARRPCDAELDAQEALANADLNADGTVAGGAPRKTFRQAATQIVIADVSMSLDNVLAVAGAAREHPTVLVIGLILSIALMGHRRHRSSPGC